MALTKYNPEKVGGNGSYSPQNLYYEYDRIQVINQANAATCGLIHYKFNNDEITVFAAMDANKQVLDLLALPCPPYHHHSYPGAEPGNIL